MNKIILADTCGLENLYNGGYIDKLTIVFGTSLITSEVIAEVGFRVPDALNSIDYAVVHMKQEEREFAEDIVDIATTLIAVSVKRNLEILSHKML